MGLLHGVIVGLNLLLVALVTALYYRLRSADRKGEQLRAEVLRAVQARHVIQSIAEMPPEMITPDSRACLTELVEETKIHPAQAVQLAIQMGVWYSDINEFKNKEAGIDDHAPFEPNTPDIEEPEERE